MSNLSVSKPVEATSGISTQVDHAALRVNQALIILLLIAAFILNSAWVAALVGVVMLVGTLA